MNGALGGQEYPVILKKQSYRFGSIHPKQGRPYPDIPTRHKPDIPQRRPIKNNRCHFQKIRHRLNPSGQPTS